MRRSIPLLAVMLLWMLVVPCTSPVAAFEEMSGVTTSISPSEATGGSNMDLVVTVHNQNNRSLTVTSLTVQIYNGPFLVSSNENQMYHINPTDALVPANGSKAFKVPGNAPNYVGPCGVFVSIGGLFDDDENASVGVFSGSITLNPNVGGFIAMGMLIVLVTIIVIVVVAVIAVLYFGKKSAPSTAYQLRCPQCGAVVPPGSPYCANCGRKL